MSAKPIATRGPRTALVPTILLTLLALLAAATVGAHPAAAAPPGNDTRTTPQVVASLPSTIRGTAVEATLEADEPASLCGRP